MAKRQEVDPRELLARARSEQEHLHSADHTHESASTEADDDHKLDRDPSDLDWERPSNMDAPPPNPGYVQRWVRVAMRNEPDQMNWMKSLREGWRPRRASTVPDGYFAPTVKHSEYGDVVGVPGMILCEMPKRKSDQRDAYYEEQFNRQRETLEDLKEKAARDGVALFGGHKKEVHVGRRKGVFG